MWKIIIPEGGCYIQILCRAVKTSAINLMIFQGKVKEKRDIIQMRDAKVLDSGPYRPGFVATDEKFLSDGGDYALVVSTYERDQVSKFVLSIFSSEKLLFESIN